MTTTRKSWKATSSGSERERRSRRVRLSKNNVDSVDCHVIFLGGKYHSFSIT